jgi:hypothetical protein
MSREHCRVNTPRAPCVLHRAQCKHFAIVAGFRIRDMSFTAYMAVTYVQNRLHVCTGQAECIYRTAYMYVRNSRLQAMAALLLFMLQSRRLRFRIPMRSLIFSIYLILPNYLIHYRTGVYSASNRNYYQNIFLGVKRVRRVRLTASPPSVSQLS